MRLTFTKLRRRRKIKSRRLKRILPFLEESFESYLLLGMAREEEGTRANSMLFLGDPSIFQELLLDLIPEVCSPESDPDTFTPMHNQLMERLSPVLKSLYSNCLLVGLKPGDEYSYVYRWFQFEPTDRFVLAQALLWGAQQVEKRSKA